MFHTADAGYFWSETRVESSLNRFEATSLTEWEECVIVAAKASPQLVHFTIFQLDYASSFPQGGHLRTVIKTTWMLQPATLGNLTVPFMRLVDLAVVTDMVVFTQGSEVTWSCLQFSNWADFKDFHLQIFKSSRKFVWWRHKKQSDERRRSRQCPTTRAEKFWQQPQNICHISLEVELRFIQHTLILLTSDGFLCWWRTHVLLVPVFLDDLDHEVTWPAIIIIIINN